VEFWLWAVRLINVNSPMKHFFVMVIDLGVKGFVQRKGMGGLKKTGKTRGRAGGYTHYRACSNEYQINCLHLSPQSSPAKLLLFFE
jgi:hypothetical protein